MIEVKEIVDTVNSFGKHIFKGGIMSWEQCQLLLFFAAVRKHGTHDFYLNDGNVKDPPGYYDISGTLFNYKYGGNNGYVGPEILKAPGPTEFPLDIMV
jgi:hypothetical protein